MKQKISRHLGIKIFFSYILVILVGIFILTVSTEVSIPSAFDRHMGSMMSSTGNSMPSMDMMTTTNSVGSELFTSFRNAVNESLLRAGLAALLVALLVSAFVSRKIVGPIRQMMTVSQHIAEGHYQQRVQVSGNPLEGDELTQLAISFNRMAEKLLQTENMRRQLIGDISHELRTPLTTIKGWLEGLMDGVLPPTPETYQEIYQETARLQRLVADLQELSRVEAGAYPLARAPLEIFTLIQHLSSRLRPQFDEKGVHLELDVPEDMPTVQADSDRLSQVLINLIGNALQYTPAGGQVKVSAGRVQGQSHPRLADGDWLLVSVQDSGIGIPSEHLPHVFTRFYRVDKSRSRAGGGSGIGLTIARHMVEAHGGRIWAESAGPGSGSTFSFALPVTSTG